MKHIFKKLHKSHNQDETPPPSPSCATAHQRTMSGNSPTSPSLSSPAPVTVPTSFGNTTAASTVSVNNSTDYMLSEEEFRVQLALAISASNSEDPEKDQIRPATLLSLGGHHQMNTGRDREEVPRRGFIETLLGECSSTFSSPILRSNWILVNSSWNGLCSVGAGGL
ncbi:hypothetical protein SLEP1_g55624 [Rubroshorea leprosula]|uniref:Uncharacterized protein n=1 Tax=Rubroshorea leprosula TaxID=152421 RepID=A0AAV5MFW3_9ROSI|nr:hypothetical protein SLEP1_g55624 [Rubroshorea leprosula]